MAAITTLTVTVIAKRQKEIMVEDLPDNPGDFIPALVDMPEDLGIATVLYTNGTTNPTVKFPVDTIKMSPSMVHMALAKVGFNLDGNRSNAQESQDIQERLLALIAAI